ncbi:MAG: MFS transporter [Armatimonadota bacterium]|nr:MFS transporter [Armatimonadota bacterium]
MSTTLVQPGQTQVLSDYWMARRNQLFMASCIALIVTAMSFAIRGDLISPLGEQFHLSKEQIGFVLGTAFWGFTLAMIIGGPLCDIMGMGRLLMLAFVGHLIGIVLTIMAHDFWTLFISTLFFGLGNGFVEAACNPLITTLFPDQKIRKLSFFHAWFPGGQVIGGLVAYAITQASVGASWKSHAWQLEMASMLLPLVIYAAMFLGKKFPATERDAAGVSMGQMFAECARPFFILFVVCMFMTAITELGSLQWSPNILTLTTGQPGILILVWVTGLMAVGRTFAGPIVHRISPVLLLMISSFLSIIGLYLVSQAHDAPTAYASATIFAAGVCFFWPTMLGVVSERFPKTGALGLAIMGGGGMLAVNFAQIVIGATYDRGTAIAAGGADKVAALQQAGGDAWIKAQAAGGSAGLQQIVILPIILLVIFTAIFLYDRSRGGYHQEVLVQDQDVPEGPVGAVA